MMESQQTVTLHFPLAHLPALLTRLTTYLLQQHHSFVQTSYATGHTDFDIFTQQQQPLMRLSFQATEDPDAWSGKRVPTTSTPLTADAVELLQHLLQTES
jgi:hypothetical protein